MGGKAVKITYDQNRVTDIDIEFDILMNKFEQGLFEHKENVKDPNVEDFKQFEKMIEGC